MARASKRTPIADADRVVQELDALSKSVFGPTVEFVPHDDVIEGHLPMLAEIPVLRGRGRIFDQMSPLASRVRRRKRGDCFAAAASLMIDDSQVQKYGVSIRYAQGLMLMHPPRPVVRWDQGIMVTYDSLSIVHAWCVADDQVIDRTRARDPAELQVRYFGVVFPISAVAGFLSGNGVYRWIPLDLLEPERSRKKR